MLQYFMQSSCSFPWVCEVLIDDERNSGRLEKSQSVSFILIVIITTTDTTTIIVRLI